MNGYYKSLTDDSVYHVYYKGFDLYARCVKCKTREVNQPFPIPEKNITKMIQWKCWVLLDGPPVD
jgi:hypothetical protein